MNPHLSKIITININDLTNYNGPTIVKNESLSYSVDECDVKDEILNLTESQFSNPNYNKVDKGINIVINLQQNIKYSGIYNSVEYIPKSSLSIIENIDVNYRPTGVNIDSYISENLNPITGVSESYLNNVVNYGGEYVVNKNLNQNPSISFDGVLTVDGDIITYVINGQVDNDGDYIESTGVIYTTNKITSETYFHFQPKSYQPYNISLQDLLQTSEYENLTEFTEPQIDVLVDRVDYDIYEKFIKLTEINTLDDLIKYGNGYFNIN